MSDNIRIRTNNNDKYIQFKIEQDFDFIEILSLKISQDNVYENFCSDYGVLVGRVQINNGFGVPNAKVSIFIPIDEIDSQNKTISGLYPYLSVGEKNSEGYRYNLLPKEGTTINPCYTPVGTFSPKREVLDNDEALYIYQKYYKFTTTTNESGDYMIFGIPVGTHTVHVDVDLSDIGILSQRPYDFIEQGTPLKYFASTTKFKKDTNLDSLPQIKSSNVGVNIKPFWGDIENCQIGINRSDIDINYTITPTAVFMGSYFSDGDKDTLNKNCRPKKEAGVLCNQIVQEGTIEMLRKNADGGIERFDVDGGRVIDEDGTWVYRIPMNLDYYVTDEFGNLIPSTIPNVGIATRARVRFRVSMDEGGLGRVRKRASFLIPHNPKNTNDIDFTFDENSKDENFADFYWNKIYSIKSFIPRVQKRANGGKTRNFIGIKDVDDCIGDKHEFPYNRAGTKSTGGVFLRLCVLYEIISFQVGVINSIIKALNYLLFGLIPLIPLSCGGRDYEIYAGSGNRQDYLDCVRAELAEEFNIYRLDFYNDWINGALYLFGLKYKSRANGKEKYCDYKCQTNPDNKCVRSEYEDTTVKSEDDNYSYPFTFGYVAKENNNLYYAPISSDGSKKLFATDIISLGSVLDCDFQNYPRIIDFIPATSFKIPPLTKEIETDYNPDGSIAGTTTTSGMIGVGSDWGLFFEINCAGIQIRNTTQAANIRRICELGVDIPETTSTTPIKAISINQIIDFTISNTSLERYVRDVFCLLNLNGSNLILYPSFNTQLLDDKTQGTSFEYDGNIGDAQFKNGNTYMSFRNYKYPNGGYPLDLGLQPFNNSYFFYFGLVPGKTAYDKLIAKYFAVCEPERIDKLAFNANSIIESINAGTVFYQIAITIINGEPPYTVSVTGPNNYIFGPNTSTQTYITTGRLSTGYYNVTVTDSTKLIRTKEIYISN